MGVVLKPLDPEILHGMLKRISTRYDRIETELSDYGNVLCAALYHKNTLGHKEQVRYGWRQLQSDGEALDKISELLKRREILFRRFDRWWAEGGRGDEYGLVFYDYHINFPPSKRKSQLYKTMVQEFAEFWAEEMDRLIFDGLVAKPETLAPMETSNG